MMYKNFQICFPECFRLESSVECVKKEDEHGNNETVMCLRVKEVQPGKDPGPIGQSFINFLLFAGNIGKVVWGVSQVRTPACTLTRWCYDQENLFQFYKRIYIIHSLGRNYGIWIWLSLTHKCAVSKSNSKNSTLPFLFGPSCTLLCIIFWICFDFSQPVMSFTSSTSFQNQRRLCRWQWPSKRQVVRDRNKMWWRCSA